RSAARSRRARAPRRLIARAVRTPPQRNNLTTPAQRAGRAQPSSTLTHNREAPPPPTGDRVRHRHLRQRAGMTLERACYSRRPRRARAYCAASEPGTLALQWASRAARVVSRLVTSMGVEALPTSVVTFRPG